MIKINRLLKQKIAVKNARKKSLLISEDASLYLPLVKATSFEEEETLMLPIADAQSTQFVDINKDIKPFGFAYYRPQNMFYSLMYCWQREFGYCRLYDEGCAAFSMIIDCEPIYFDYAGKKWMIEFWKGQYGMTTGCEIGVYNTTIPYIDIPNIFHGTFYEAVPDEDRMPMAFTLIKKDKILFYRSELHWWLTGFRLGEFSEPEELTMHAQITLKDNEMRDAFIGGLMRAGYKKNEIAYRETTVGFVYDKPKSKQPFTRTPILEFMMQTNNKRNCFAYNEATKLIGDPLDKFVFVKNEAPKMYNKMLNIRQSQNIFKDFELLNKYNLESKAAAMGIKEQK
ncbi:DUF4474 domain-containing protein [Anaerocolumna xylanovorans]|uniref:DUF4474 domain-containing protein n=1 Tax=Anaerocolumna xylanovorans DSM 12503 TaxID=1121345 RepID=A0A1M7YNB8_9FIRM|nr:DUF4474 domain-containing protein [Anaerocolumna xylanovorans]SHO54038.1 protein of unknown function [Anaerocolumna xylanovorans DSM 12503]